MRPGAALGRVVALALVAWSLSGCQSMLFRNDHRIDILSPSNLSTVSQPVTLQWSARDFSAPASGTFAVFVDRDPMPPGDGLDDFNVHDRQGIYVLDGTSLHLDALAPQAGADPAEQNHHDVTVVMLDTQGHRIGEYAAFTEFTVQAPQ
jgi:hypothetical protein